MKINVKAKPYKGYVFFPRVIMVLFKDGNKSLDFGALGDFIAFAAECDWDKKHPTYGYLTKPDEYLASRWGCDISTIWRKKMKLKKLGLLRDTASGFLRLHYMEWLFEAHFAKELAKQEIANSQELVARTQELIASSQRNIADTQDVQGQDGTQSFNVSSKEDLSVGFNEDSYKSNKDKELENMMRVAEEVFGDD